MVDDDSGISLDDVVVAFRDSLYITLLQQPHAGPATARNTGAMAAKAEYLAFTDDDCQPSSDWLQRLAVRLKDTPECAIGGRTINMLDDNPYSNAGQLLIDYMHGYFNTNAREAHFLTSNNLSISTDLFRRVGGFDTTFSKAGGEDREFCTRLKQLGYRVIYAPEAKVFHRHRLKPSTFFRKHFIYGRGALKFHKKCSERLQKHVGLEPLSFYLRLLLYPFSRPEVRRQPLIAGLLAVSQVANALGFGWEYLHGCGGKRADRRKSLYPSKPVLSPLRHFKRRPVQLRFADDYWSDIVGESSCRNREDFWRAYLKEIYQRLIGPWMEKSDVGRILKTDLYDEAISRHGLIPLCGQKCNHIVGIDMSIGVAMAAHRRMMHEWGGWHDLVCSDVRRLAFKPDSFDHVISNSTLDHFSDKKDITASLNELRRIMKPGGTLIITLDNPSNPIVFLRNLLPYRLLKFLGFIPFYMGVTLSRSELISSLESSGFAVHDVAAIVHSPRMLAIWVGYILDRVGAEQLKGGFCRILKAFEHLEKSPMSYLTGYFISAKAAKGQVEGPSTALEVCE